MVIPKELQATMVNPGQRGTPRPRQDAGAAQGNLFVPRDGGPGPQAGEANHAAGPTMAAGARRLQGPDREEVLSAHLHRPVLEVSGGGGLRQQKLGEDGAAAGPGDGAAGQYGRAGDGRGTPLQLPQVQGIHGEEGHQAPHLRPGEPHGQRVHGLQTAQFLQKT